MVASSATANLKSYRTPGTATTISKEGEECIVQWINSLRGEGVPVSRLMLQLQAQQVASDEGVADGVFSGSWCWQQGFLSRHGMSLRTKTRQGQKTPAAMDEAALKFWQDVEQAKNELGVDKFYNADESGICFEYLPKQTVNNKGVNTVWVKCGGKDKERLTGMFLADSSGKQYDPFFVVKTEPSRDPKKAVYNYVAQHGFGDALWKTMQAIQKNIDVQIYGNSSAWFNSGLSVAFLDYHFANRDEPNRYFCFPPGLTSVCQPADISWFRPLKERLRKRWVQHLSEQLQSFRQGNTSDKFQLNSASRDDAIYWATAAWKYLGASVIQSGFKRQFAVSKDIEHENQLVEALERLQLIEETVSESDDVIIQFIDVADDK
ncbi:hypothetical protein PHPALM_7874 [Phytophthora palmivora]|uniref:HTH CENPB-type domain-containing protein n=1 Tax=Phytophthora palmivora TaxID=4796 RepID=A0A2P4YBB6_9STRA|nr:hypothetical protein PHPALM_7874 [Phytophthora palmivora]